MSKSVLYLGGFELPDKNAAAQRVLANAKLLREMDFEVSFIGISKDIENAPKSVDGFASNPVPYPKNTREWAHQIFTFVNKEAILSAKPDYVVLYNFPAVASLRILHLCHRHGIKVIHDLTEWDSSKGRTLRDFIRKIDINLRMHFCVKQMDGVIAISRYLYEYYRKYTTTIMIPPTVDLSDKKWDRNRVLSSSSNTKLVFAGSAEYGTKDRLDVIISAVSKHPEVLFNIVGLTEEVFIKGYGVLPQISDNIIFHGRLSHKEAVCVVQDSDFQLLIRDSSRKNNAGFPTKFVESMACCTPIIATLTSNIGDYLIDGKNGYIVNDEQSLEDILRIISKLSPIEKTRMKKACRSLTAFDYHAYRDAMEKIFK